MSSSNRKPFHHGQESRFDPRDNRSSAKWDRGSALPPESPNRYSNSQRDRDYGSGQRRDYRPPQGKPSSQSQCWDLPPSSTLILRGLAFSSTEDSIWKALARFQPVQIRLICHKETGESRGFAFADFNSVDDATALMEEFDSNPLVIDGRTISLGFGETRPLVKMNRQPRLDWICVNCEANNFSRRTVCFKCNHPRTDDAVQVPQHSDSRAEGLSEAPSDVLIVRSIPLDVQEEEMYQVFRDLAPIKDVRLVVDKVTGANRGFGFVDFLSVEDATRVLQISSHIQLGGFPVRISFARPSQPSKRSDNALDSSRNPIALAALEQAQWSNSNGYGFGPNQDHTRESAEMALATTPVLSSAPNAEPRKEWPTPFEEDIAGYILDSSSGFYFDATSSFYYHPSSKRYFSSYLKQYFVYSPTTKSFSPFLPPFPSETAAEEEIREAKRLKTLSSNANKSEASRKPKISFGIKLSQSTKGKAQVTSVGKKHAEEIAKWSMRQKEDKDASEIVASPTPPAPPSSTLQPTSKSISKPKPKPDTLTVTSSSATEASRKAMVDTENLICRLCRRKFSSAEQLKKHVAISKLHLANLAKRKAASSRISNPDPTKSAKYRDRARERRDFFGDAGPESVNANRASRSGSDLPVSDALDEVFPKTSPSQIPLDETNNIGGKMLKMMGWKEGTGLGKGGHGITAPVVAVGNVSSVKAGLGAASGSILQPGSSTSRDHKQVARERYEALCRNEE